ncbi:MAG: hypothetical protein ACK4YT_13670, partial [Sphingomonas sp.]
MAHEREAEVRLVQAAVPFPLLRDVVADLCPDLRLDALVAASPEPAAAAAAVLATRSAPVEDSAAAPAAAAAAAGYA